MDTRDSGLGGGATSFFLPAALVALLLPLLAGQPVAPAARETRPAEGAPASAPNAMAPLPRSSGLLLLEAHLGRPATRLDTSVATYLLATVPDPILSRLDYTYDRYLDAIQRALERAGYRLDRFDIPWMRQRGQLEDQLKSATGAMAPEFARKPGLMLFRSDEQAPLLVFIVGETPTGGVQKEAFSDALTQIADMQSWTGAGPREPWRPCDPAGTAGEPCRVLRVLGPSFTGAAESVGRGLKEWLASTPFTGPEPTVRLITGGATGIGYGSPLFSPDSTRFPEGQLDFSATILPDAIVRDAFIKYLTSVQGANCRHIALLTEANTAYGRHLSQKLGGARYSEDDCGSDILTLPFPLHIAELRGEAERARPADGAEPVDLLGSGRRNLPIGLTEGRVDRSVVAWASTQEAATNELMLSNLLSTIAQEGIRYVGLFSTDVKDRIFLAKEIRQRAPDTTLFTYTSDQLYLHTDYNAAFRGMLVASTYPLFPLNQSWSQPYEGVRSRLLFPNGNAQGVFNAVLTLIGRDDLMLEFARPFDAGSTLVPTRPALWLSIVGRDALWPVTLLDYEPLPLLTYERRPPSEAVGLELATVTSDQNLARIRELGEQGVLTRTATTILFGLVLACGVGGLLIFSAACRPPRLGTIETPAARRRRMRVFGYAWLHTTRGDGTLDTERWSYVLVLAALVAALQLILCAVLVLPVWSLSHLLQIAPWKVGHWLLTAFRLVALGTLLVPVAAIGRLLQQPARCGGGWGEVVRRPQVLTPAVIALALLGGALTLAAGWITQPKLDTLFLCLRASHLSSGLSPLVPLVFMAIAGVLWCLCTLSRLSQVEALDGLSLLDIGERSWASVARLEDRVRYITACPPLALPGGAVWPLLSLLGLAALTLVSGASGTIESRLFEGLFLAAWTASYAGVALAFLRSVFVWKAMKVLLSHVAYHPLSPALAPFYKDSGGRLQIDPAREPRAMAGLALSVDAAASLSRALDAATEASASGEVRAMAGEAQTQLDLALEAEVLRDAAAVSAATRRAHVALSGVGWACGRLLAPYWSVAVAGHEALSSPPAAGDPRTPPAAQAAGGRPEPGARSGAEDTAGEPSAPRAVKRPEWVGLAERFVATRLADFIYRTRALMRGLTLFGTSALVLMLVAVTSYPFHPKGQLQLFNWTVVLAFVFATMSVFVQMSRDRVLSDLSGTKPGELTWNRELLARLLIYGAVPILGLLGAQFPDVFRRLQPWFSSLAGVK